MQKIVHSWELSPREAISLQSRLRTKVVTRDRVGRVRHVAGTDVGFENGGAVTRAAVAVLTFPGLELTDWAVIRQPTRFPYVPGLLSFREIPALLAALSRLEVRPDLVLCDGQGLAHPRRCGLASHLGLVTGWPTIGVAKSRLIGTYREPPQRRGAWTALRDGDEMIGAVLRSRPKVKPLFISVGHGVSLEKAVSWTMACVTRYRLPETTRWAHRLASGPEIDRSPARRHNAG